MLPWALLAAALLPTGFASGQEAAAAHPSVAPGPPYGTDRPIVGLVLSGGGARGLAHIGVLEVLEDARVPVDLVVGTSMGAIVGGLFAAGVTPGEMRAWIRSADWGDLFDDDPSHRDLPIRRKRLAREFPIGVELGVGPGGIQVPTGLVTGQKLNRELRRLLYRVAAVRSFDDLPIPYRAVATDLATGGMVVLSSGDLVGALRASMSVPGFFTPYTVEGRSLVDGGIARNIPVDVARAMGADVVIVADVTAPLASPDSLRSIIDVTGQVTTIATRAGSIAHLASLGEGDILIRPPLEHIGATAFEKGMEAADIGHLAAAGASRQLERLAVAPYEFEARRKAGLERQRPPGHIDYLATGSTYRRGSRHLLGRLRVRPGAMLDTTLLQADLDGIFATGIYELVDYQIQPTPDGDLLLVDAREKRWGPNYLRFRLAVEDDFSGGGSYSFASNLLVPEVNRGGGELNIQTQLGDIRRLRLELHQPLDPTRSVFVEPYADYSRLFLDRYDAGRRIARMRMTNRTLGLDLGLELGGLFEARFGAEAGDSRAEPEIGPSDLTALAVDRAGFHGQLTIDRLDDPYIPREGYGVYLAYVQEIEGLGADIPYRLVTTELMHALRTERHTLLTTASFASSLGTILPEWAPVRLGGFLALSGHARGEIRGNYLGMARVILMRELKGPGLLGAISVEAGKAWDRPSEIRIADPHLGAAIALGARTPVGPLYLGLGFGEGGRRQTYFLVGRGV